MKKMKHAVFLLVTLAVSLTVQIGWAQEKNLNVFWKDGLRFNTEDDAFQMKIGGRIQNDWAFFMDDNFGDDGVEFRRARLYVSGLIYEDFEFKTQYDFAGGGDAEFKDVYIGLTNIDYLGGIRVGHFKEPFSLEELTSSKYITFLERGLPNIFAPSRNVGAMIHNAVFEERMTYAAGVFRETDSFGESSSEESWNVTGRVTGLPWYEDDGAKLLHLGAGITYKDLGDWSGSADGKSYADFNYSARPEAHQADKILKTRFAAGEPDDVISAGAELALVCGPGSLQSEYMYSVVDQNTLSSVDLQGFYVQASYFLTGEHRPYKTSSAKFDKVKPLQNFLSDEGGLGAWELALRYSWLDMEDEDLSPSSSTNNELSDITLGLNWYMNPNVRVMWNYTHAKLDGGNTNNDEDNILQMRFQVFF